MFCFGKEKFKENFDLFEIKDKLKVCHLGTSVRSHPFLMLKKKASCLGELMQTSQNINTLSHNEVRKLTYDTGSKHFCI